MKPKKIAFIAVIIYAAFLLLTINIKITLKTKKPPTVEVQILEPETPPMIYTWDDGGDC